MTRKQTFEPYICEMCLEWVIPKNQELFSPYTLDLNGVRMYVCYSCGIKVWNFISINRKDGKA